MFTTEQLSTFRTNHLCRNIFRVHTFDQLQFARTQTVNPLIVGGGSNLLFTREVLRDIIVIAITGIDIVEESAEYVIVRATAGESWHQLVLWAVTNGYGGIENLSLIPGKCGAAPMQNIGAYGVEICDVIQTVEAISLKDGSSRIFTKSECQFGYRESIFKHKERDQYIITAIVIKLTKPGFHIINDGYGAIKSELSAQKIQSPSILDISEAVIRIRSSKLPNPELLPNAGSFFKNPIVSSEIAENISLSYPEMPSYPADGRKVKLAAGWLIDKAGWRGKRIGQVGCHKDQALVIVNYGELDGMKILNFSKEVQTSVYDKFGVLLDPEVNIF